MLGSCLRRHAGASSALLRRQAASRGAKTFAARGASLRAFSAQPVDHDEQDAILEKRVNAAREELVTLTQAFKRYDGNRDGSLDRSDLRQMMEDIQWPGNDMDLLDMIDRMDDNNDGKIQLTEWLDNLPKGTRVRIVSQFKEGDSPADAHRTVRLSVPTSRIIYTYTDEAPMLATHSLLPVVRAFAKSCAVDMELRDISLAGRILANFPDFLAPNQRVEDELSYLGELAKTPAANIIKLPNISASVPQLLEAIKELQDKGYALPDFPMNPTTSEDKQVRARYAKVLGSAVNPVLREGNSDRRVALPVKQYAQNNPHRLAPWSGDSKTHVAHMTEGDFFGNEVSAVMPSSTSVRIEHVDAAGNTTVLKKSTSLQQGEVIDATRMDTQKLRAFFEAQMQEAKEQDVLLSLHLKATMMKVSDPIMFGHAVTVYYKDVFEKHAALFEELGVNANNGVGDVYAKIATLPEAQKAEIEADLKACYETRPRLAMVDSRRGITNLHAPNDIIIDASVPPVIRDSGKMWGDDDELHDTKMLIPDRCYATMYQKIVEDCQAHGAFDVSTMGNVPNVGLMAQKAQEYGSHDKTFEIPADGRVRVVDAKSGDVVFDMEVGQGDIWRMCQTKDAPIQDWVKLAVTRARVTGTPAVFWLNKERAHDASLITKVEEYLQDHDTSGIEIQILAPVDAMEYTLARIRKGEDTISVTGNVLRDYLTDLFPILELGTSAKMLSIVPLLAGGGLFETGAGGSAPKHVQQLTEENHLRWDSLGEFLAIAVSIEDLSAKTDNPQAKIIADALNSAVGSILSENKSPSRKVNELDNRGSHFYLALYWAQALASQTQDAGLAERFTHIASDLEKNEDVILQEMNAVQGSAVSLGGYYSLDPEMADRIMRPSPTFNGIIDALEQSFQEEVRRVA